MQKDVASSPSEKWQFRPRQYTHFDHAIYSEHEANQRIKQFQKSGKHSFLPFLEETFKMRRFAVYLEKLRRQENGEDADDLEVDKTRPIKRAAHVDAQIFSYYRFLLSQRYEATLSELGLNDCVIAYRKISVTGSPQKGKCNIHFAKEAFDEVCRREEATVFTLDISKFFESLDHDFLAQKWCELLGEETLPDDHKAVFKAMTDYSVVNLDQCYEKLGLIELQEGKKYFLHCPFFINENRKMLCSKDEYRDLIVANGLVQKNNYRGLSIPQGIPQGSPISDILANLYMIDFDREISLLAGKFNSYYRRYSDDILLICPSTHANEIRQAVADALLRQGRATLKMNETKSKETVFSKHNKEVTYSGDKFKYLGFFFDGKQALYRDETMQRYERDTTFSIRSFIQKAHVRSIGDKAKKIIGNGRPLKSNLNISLIFHKLMYANKAYIQAQREKNRSLTDYSTCAMILNELGKINLNQRLDLSKTDFRNSGHAIRYHANSYELAFYDKIKDMQQAKNSEKRALESDCAVQMDLFTRREYIKPLEVLRIEIRIGSRVKLRGLLKTLNIKGTTDFGSLFKESIAKKMLLHFWHSITQDMPLLALSQFKPEDIYYALVAETKGKAKPAKVLQQIGALMIIRSVSMRGLHSLVSQHSNARTWQRMKRELESPDLTNRMKYAVITNVQRCLEEFKPLRMKDYELTQKIPK